MKGLKGLRRLALGMMILAILGSIYPCFIVGRADPLDEIKDKLSGISEEEREILQDLFTLSQEIEIMEMEEKKLSGDMEQINRRIGEIEAAVKAGEESFKKRQESLRQVLRSYQRMGPGSFLEIILDSDSLSTFLQRINTLRDLTRNTGELLEQLDADGKRLREDKAALSESLVLIEDRRIQAGKVLEEKLRLREEREAYLASLKDSMEYYREYLSNIEKVWTEMKSLFTDAAAEFSRIVRQGNIPSEALKIKLSLTEIRGAIADSVINKVISEQSSLPTMIFSFHPGKVDISLPDNYLELSGTFIIEEGHKLRFQAQEGSFYGMTLEQGSLEELLAKGDLVLDIDPLLGGNSINGLEIKEGQLELINRFKLF